jgi:hypothetical protein
MFYDCISRKYGKAASDRVRDILHSRADELLGGVSSDYFKKRRKYRLPGERERREKDK